MDDNIWGVSLRGRDADTDIKYGPRVNLGIGGASDMVVAAPGHIRLL